MYRIQPLCYLNSGTSNSEKYSDVKQWVAFAIAEEEQRSDKRLWQKENSAEYQFNERQRRIRFLRKHELRFHPQIKQIADRLESCDRFNRCCSGACPECGRLIQRWFVRKSKPFIRDHIDKPDQQLVALSIVPASGISESGNLHTLFIDNLQRRLKYALDKADIKVAIGGIDFSFNEDRNRKNEPHWAVHFYLITCVANRDKTRRILKRFFEETKLIARPIKIPHFDNSARRRSYALKIYFGRRIAGLDNNRRDGRKCRNTSRDKLRSAERLELLRYLDRVGFASRFVLRSTKPVVNSIEVTLKFVDGKSFRIKAN